MKRTLLLLVSLPLALSCSAQEPQRIKEIGFTLTSLNGFGLTFRTGKPKSLWRFNSMSIGGIQQKTGDDLNGTLSKNSGAALKVGREYRKNILDNLEMRFGLDLVFSYSESTDISNSSLSNSSTTSNQYGRGAQLVFGFNYIIKKSFVIGAEILPYYTYYSGSKSLFQSSVSSPPSFTQQDTSGFSYGFNSSSVLVSFLYRF